MDLFQFGRGELVGSTVVGFDVPVQTFGLLEEPDNALSAGLVQP